MTQVNILSILREIDDTSKRTEKESILRNLTVDESKLFKSVAHYAYSMEINYYIIEYKRSKEHTGEMSLNEALRILQDKIVNRVVTGNAALAVVEDIDRKLSADDAEVFNRIIKRDLRCGVGPSTINKIWDDFSIYIHPYMRASSFNEKNLKSIKFPCYSQVKMDGMYCDIIIYQLGKVEFRARSGEILTVLNDPDNDKNLSDVFGPNTVLQGELVAEDEDGLLMERSKSNGYINSNEVDINRVKFVAWNMLSLEDFLKKKTNIEYSKCLTELEFASRDSRFVKSVETIRADDFNQLVDHFKDVRKRGEEGLIIKNTGMKWKNGTSKEQIKIKPIWDCDLIMTGYKEGTEKYVGSLGAIEFTSSCGKLKVSVGTGYTDEQRKELWNKDKLDEMIARGQIGVVRANDVSVTDDGMSLVHPRFVEFRFDKTDADDFERIEEQSKSFVDLLRLIEG